MTLATLELRKMSRSPNLTTESRGKNTESVSKDYKMRHVAEEPGGEFSGKVS